MKNKDLLLGKTDIHIDKSFNLHHEVVSSLQKLQAAAKENGFDLQVISGFRSFERQLSIWNAKASGKRKIYDDNDLEINIESLSKKEILYAILRFSALPGASRHHWGSDFDVYDANAIDKKDVKLTPNECIGNGPCASMHSWLSEIISQDKSFGFFRPYKDDLGGVAPELWHLSDKNLSESFYQQYSYELFINHINSIEIELKQIILDESKNIYENFIMNVSRE